MSNDFNSGDFDVSNDSDNSENSYLSDYETKKSSDKNDADSFHSCESICSIYNNKKNIFNLQKKQTKSSNDNKSNHDKSIDSKPSTLVEGSGSGKRIADKQDKENDTSSDNDTDSDIDSIDSNDKNKKHSKKKPIKTKKMPLKDAIKTVEERSLYTKIDRFFKTECSDDKIQKMIKIINNEDQISLRLLNWFAMKHSATMESLEIIDDDGNHELFDVKISYRARLNTHSKKYFDPFRRGKRFDYHYDKKNPEKTVETTLCQLNFFRWLFLHDLMDYVEDQFDNLKQKMGTYNNVEKKKKETKKEKESLKKTIIKNKKEDIKIKVKRFNEDNTSKLVIII